MKSYAVSATQRFDCSVSALFRYLSDPRHLAAALSMPCEVVRRSDSESPFGEGMVKKVKAAGLPAFEETITCYRQDEYIAYQVTKGGIVKDHLGEMHFHPLNNGSQLEYQITFSPRWPLPFLGSIIRQQLQKSLQQALVQIAQNLNS